MAISTKATAANIERVLAILAETPQRIAQYSADLTEAQCRQPLATGEWSLVEVLCHLRACEEVWAATITAMLLVETPTIPFIHPRRYTRLVGYERLPFAESLAMFTARRRDLLRLLDGLSGEAWQRDGIIKGCQHTVYSQARRMALHERAHFQGFDRL